MFTQWERFSSLWYSKVDYRRRRTIGYARPQRSHSPRMIHFASLVYNVLFLFEGRKMNFRVPYGSREILNVFCGLGLTFSISRPLYGPQKFILRPEDKKIIYTTTDAICNIPSSATFGGFAPLGPKGRTRQEWYILRPWCIMYYFVRRPQNEFPRPIWKSRNPKCITLLYIEYFAASIRAAKSQFAAWGQQNYLKVK